MLSPDDFRVNEAWIAFRVNDEFLFVDDDPHDVYALMDAASAYVFGQVFFKTVDQKPSKKDVTALFKKGFSAKRQWAKRLIVTDNSPAEKAFIQEAQQHGLSVETVPLSDLEPIVGDFIELFRTGFMGMED